MLRLAAAAAARVAVTTASAPARAASTAPKMGRATRGMYGGKEVAFGNRVSHSQRKTRRRWNPNVQSVALYSETLGRQLRFPATTAVLRAVDKAGGLDSYLLRSPPRRFANDPFAAELRERLATHASASLPSTHTLDDVRAIEAALVLRYGRVRG